MLMARMVATSSNSSPEISAIPCWVEGSRICGLREVLMCQIHTAFIAAMMRVKVSVFLDPPGGLNGFASVSVTLTEQMLAQSAASIAAVALYRSAQLLVPAPAV